MTQVAMVILGQHSVPLARRLLAAIPQAKLYGLANRTTDVDVHFTNFGETLRELFRSGSTIVGICASGILIRTLAPLLTDKWYEPPVLAVAEDGSAVVPLLGGLHGVNDLARQLAEVLQITPAITTTGEIRFRTALLSPPSGYHLAYPEQAKTFLADLLAGAAVRLEGHAPWLQESQLPVTEDAPLTIQVTERVVLPTRNCLVYHPTTVAIGMYRDPGRQGDEAKALRQVTDLLGQAGIASASVAGLFSLDTDASDPILQAVARTLHVSSRFFTPADLTATLQAPVVSTDDRSPAHMAAAIALAAVGQGGQLMPAPALSYTMPYTCVLARASYPLEAQSIGRGRGWLAIVGVGPGAAHWLSPEVRDVLHAATDWVGYSTYLDLAEPFRREQQRHASDNHEELGRACLALDLAAQGRAVALVSSGDPGIYAMAAAVFEVLEGDDKPAWQSIDIQVCPGISAMQAAAAQVGAPLGHDFCVISLSDILKPWSVIEQRIAAAAQADFVLALYNPVSTQRTWQLSRVKEIVLQWRSPHTPVIIARNIGRPGQVVTIKPLEQLQVTDADMRTVLLVGSSQTRIIDRDDGQRWVYTPRRYVKRHGTLEELSGASSTSL
jgi:cobalt-precorrin 5A hydrolase/precorrin-3B C17-methyltransferase